MCKIEEIYLNTEIVLSKVNSRDGIFISSVYQDYMHSTLTFTGKARLENHENKEHYEKFRLVFSKIISYCCIELDLCHLDIKMVSNFNIIQNSDFIRLNNIHNFNHYALSSYDYTYQIIAKSVMFEILR